MSVRFKAVEQHGYEGTYGGISQPWDYGKHRTVGFSEIIRYSVWKKIKRPLFVNGLKNEQQQSGHQ